MLIVSIRVWRLGVWARPGAVAPPDLRLREAQLCRQLGSLRQGQVLRRLEFPLQHCQLVAGVDGPGLSHLLRLPVDHPDLGVRLFFYWTREKKNNIVQYVSAIFLFSSHQYSTMKLKRGIQNPETKLIINLEAFKVV